MGYHFYVINSVNVIIILGVQVCAGKNYQDRGSLCQS